MAVETADPRRLVACLRGALPDPASDAIDAIIEAAGAPVWAVGGTVRDLLLGREITDVDLALEGVTAPILRAALPHARVTAHQRFGTATATVGGVRIDLAMTRSESYPRAGALPEVEPASIEADLARRDFSCNALALRLSGEPQLLDILGGATDIAGNRLRVLHEQSFVDDPTRIFRAFRYAARLDFVLEPTSASLLASSLPHIRRVGGERLRRELELLLGDEPAGSALEAAHSAGALQVVHPALHWSRAKREAFADDRLVPAKDREAFGFALLASGANDDDADGVTRRLRLKREQAAAVHSVAALRRMTELLRRPDLKPSGAAMLLDRMPAPAVAAYAYTTGNTMAREIMLRYLGEWRLVRTILTGRDLIEMGIPAGPNVQQGLLLIRAARLDGWAHDRDDERALVMRFAKSIRESTAMQSPVEFDAGTE